MDYGMQVLVALANQGFEVRRITIMDGGRPVDPQKVEQLIGAFAEVFRIETMILIITPSGRRHMLPAAIFDRNARMYRVALGLVVGGLKAAEGFIPPAPEDL